MIAFLLFAGMASAQRAGGFGRGGGVRIGPPGIRSNIHFGHSQSRHFVNSGSVLVPWAGYPLWYDDPFAYETAESDLAMNIAAPSQRTGVPQNAPLLRAPDTPAQPKLIEVPGSSDAANGKPQPLAIFILATGERLQARRYMLTSTDLRATVAGQQKVIPIAMLNLDATVAANRALGIELHIPADKNEISLGF
jgi:hypothetical protein